jgi:AraC-like DNA-binding protein
VSEKKPTPAEAATWRRRTFEIQVSEVVAGRASGPEPPRPWAERLRKLVQESQRTEEGPAWWTPVNAYFGSVETRTDPHAYYWDGMKRIGRRDLPLVFFQLTLAGFGHFELYGRAPQRITPGMGFFAVVPSRHRYYLPPASPGWTFAWIGIYHPYLYRRIARQVQVTGPIIEAAPGSALVSHLTRLVRGAFRKDFRDRYAVEAELLAFTHEYERLAQHGPQPEGERLLEALRERVLAEPRAELDVGTLAKEHRTTPSAFGHYFRAHTGISPARFVTEVRLQAAARMLAATDLPLSRIAHDCGFANANHFGKVFRRHRHQSAGAYRRSVG